MPEPSRSPETPRQSVHTSSCAWRSPSDDRESLAPPRANKKAARSGRPFHNSKRLCLARQKALALQTLALQLAIAADRLGPFAGALLARLLVVASELHLAEDALTLHLLFQRLQRLVDIVVANDDLQNALLQAQIWEARVITEGFWPVHRT